MTVSISTTAGSQRITAWARSFAGKKERNQAWTNSRMETEAKFSAKKDGTMS
jgi:hypothetical protein